MNSSVSEPVPNSNARPAARRLGPLLAGGVMLVGLATAITVYVYRRVDALPTSLPVDEFRIGLNAPYITTAQEIADKMVEVAELTEDDFVYDLGCGDGRLVITAALKHGCRGVGIDIDPERIAEANANARAHGVEHLVEFREQDVFTVDLRDADVVLMYLLPWMTKRLIPQFEQMPAGSRIVSHDFGIGDLRYIEPDQTWKVPVRDALETHLVHRWNTPLAVPPPRQ